MIRLQDAQTIKLSQIDAVVASLNTMNAKTPALIEAGVKAIHTAIVSKA